MAFSTVPTVMIFDDHDVHDDWNISWLWVEEMRRTNWWESRITGAFMAYWLYQHLGNLSPPELEEDTTFLQVKGEREAGPLLRRLAHTWDRESAASRWAFYRDFGDTRLLVLDSRAARVLSDGRRQMVDDEEWDWIVDHSSGAFDHLIIASTLPVFLPRGIHHLQAWNESLCAGRWGRLLAGLSERTQARRGSRALGGVQPVVRAAVQLATDDRPRRRGHPSSGFDPASRRRRPLQLGKRDRSRPERVVQGPPDRLFTVSQSALGEGAPRREGDRLPHRREDLLPPGEAGRVDSPSATWRPLRPATFENTLGELVLVGRAGSLTIWRSPREGEDVERLVVDQRTALT
jgi:hypothetical protein